MSSAASPARPRAPVPPVLALLIVAACGGAPAATARTSPPTDDHAFDPCAASEVGDVDCAGWRGWTQVNAARFVSNDHRRVPVDVFVPPGHADAYRDRRRPAPVGLRVVKAQYGADGAVTGLTVMAKMAPGYDPAHGDWSYGVYDPTGIRAAQQGRLRGCIACHERAADRDYLVGVPNSAP